MDIDRCWPLFDDFVIELGDARSASTRTALARIHRHVVTELGDDLTVEGLWARWPDLLAPEALPQGHGLAVRYVATLRRFAARLLADHAWTDAIEAAERAIEARAAERGPDPWATEAHPRFGWVPPRS